MEGNHLDLPPLQNTAKAGCNGYWADGTWHVKVQVPIQVRSPGEFEGGPTWQEWQAVATLQADNEARWYEQSRMAHQLLRDWEAMPDREAQETVPGAGEPKQAPMHISPLQWRHEKEQWAQGPTGQLQSSEQLQAATGWINWAEMTGQVAQETVPGAGAQEQAQVHVSPLQWKQERKSRGHRARLGSFRAANNCRQSQGGG